MDPTVFYLTILIIGIILFINLLIYGTTLRAKSVLNKLKNKLEKTGESIVLKEAAATFFGLKSLGGGQIRGKGILTLTEKNIYFIRYFPKKEIIIPLESIEEIDTAKSYLGKNIYADLLKIGFKEEEVAFHVSDVDEWIEAINKVK